MDRTQCLPEPRYYKPMVQFLRGCLSSVLDPHPAAGTCLCSSGGCPRGGQDSGQAEILSSFSHGSVFRLPTSPSLTL